MNTTVCSSWLLLLLLLILGLISSGCFAAAAHPHGSKVKRKSIPALFSFGDSQLDAGNNLYIANSSSRVDFAPYGETFFHRPTGRFTNGRTIADFIALALGLPLLRPSLDPNVTSYSRGTNFASGGSGLLDSTSLGAGVLPMSAQLQQFHTVVDKLQKEHLGNSAAVRKLLSESLYIITSGSNDIGLNYLQNTTLQQTVKPQEFVSSLIQQYSKTILTLHEHGARKIAVFELGVLGCTPFSRYFASLSNQTGCLTVANQLGILFNENLQKLIIQLRKQLPDAKLVLGKTFDIFNSLITKGTNYGFESTTAACCGAGPYNAAISCGKPVPVDFPYKPFTGKRPSKFLFWDGSHPTEAAYFIVFQQLWNGGVEAIEPFNLGQLVAMRL